MKKQMASYRISRARFLPLLIALLLPLQMWGEDVKAQLMALPGISDVE